MRGVARQGDIVGEVAVGVSVHGCVYACACACVHVRVRLIACTGVRSVVLDNQIVDRASVYH